MKKFYLIPAFLFVIATIGFAETWTSYTMENCQLPSNRILTVCIEPTGIKWFGTDAGLARFDGTDWLVFTKTSETQTLADNVINDITFEITNNGPEIWIGTENGLSILAVDAYTFATPYRNDNRPILSNHVRAVEVDSNHVKWIATDNGVSIFDGHSWADLTKENSMLVNNDIVCIGIDNDGDSLWRYIGTSHSGISRVSYYGNELAAALADTNQNPLDAITSASPYTADWTYMWNDSITAIQVIHPQKHWVGTTYGVFEHDSTETKELWTYYLSVQGLADNSVTSLAEGSDGSIWVGTKGGASNILNMQISSFTEADGLVNNAVNDVAVDTDGSIWFATEAGVSHYSNINAIGTPRTLPAKSRLVSNYPNPFNASTVILYYLGSRNRVQLSIYDLSGKKITQLIDEMQSPDYYRIFWDGKDQFGRTVPAGIYFARLNIIDSQISDCVKMLLIK